MFSGVRRALGAQGLVFQQGVRFFAKGKPKTHSGAKKRFKLTASGRVKYAQ